MELRSLRILTLNTHKGFSALKTKFVLSELRDAIRSISADLVFLQEVSGENKRNSSRVENWPKVPQYEYLADTIWPEFAYGMNAVYTEGHHGNAILSKFPIRHKHNENISTYALEKRGLLHCEIGNAFSNEQAIHCICVHLGLLGRHRKQQFSMIADYVEENIPANTPLIVAGDFNDWLQNGDRTFCQRLGIRESHKIRYGMFPKTFPSKLPLLSLDRIYVRGLTVLHAETLNGQPWSNLSDHNPLVAETLPLDWHYE